MNTDMSLSHLRGDYYTCLQCSLWFIQPCYKASLEATAASKQLIHLLSHDKGADPNWRSFGRIRS